MIGSKLTEEPLKDQLKVSKLDWDVVQLPLYRGEKVNVWDEEGVTPETRPTSRIVDTHKINVRSDTQEALGIVGAGYEVLQNDELAAIAEAIEDKGGGTVHSAGCFRGGRDVFYLIENSSFELPGEDRVHTYHIFGNNHAGERNLYFLPTSMRPFCQNMLNALLREGAGRGFRIKHTRSMKQRIEEAMEAIGKSSEELEGFRLMCSSLASKRADYSKDEFFDACYTKLYGPMPEGPWSEMDQGERKKITRKDNAIDEWNENFERDLNQHDNPSLWTAFNAVTEWVDHSRSVRGGKSDMSLREYSNVLGSAAKAKDKLFKFALSYA